MIHWRQFRKTFLTLTWLALMSAQSTGRAAAQQSEHRPVIGPGDHCQVAVTLADLRREPVAAEWRLEEEGRYPVDPLQETQLLFGEEVRVHEVRGQWVRIEALEQVEFTRRQRWEGYPGWLPAKVLRPRLPNFHPNAVVVATYAELRDSPEPPGRVVAQVPIGARLQIERQTEGWACVRWLEEGSAWIRQADLQLAANTPGSGPDLRKSIVRTATRFLDQPYLWGGQSWHIDRTSGQATGVDCSGLVHLAYRINGVAIPRDAHDQSLRARPIRPREVRPADLIFLARLDSPERVYHVLMSMGGDEAIEAVHEENVVRRTTLSERLGTPLRDLDRSGKTQRLMVRVGRLLPD
jgi:cell wall-associated NlpC family hydrolase